MGPGCSGGPTSATTTDGRPAWTRAGREATITDPVQLSRRVAYVLRHHPGSVGIELDLAGWVDVDELLAALSSHGPTVTRADIRAVLTEIPKQRFEVAAGRIRATHGHSVDVDLGLAEMVPPAVLFHGTVARFLDAILEEGLRPGGRRAVHLSSDEPTAQRVGSRRGEPVVLRVDAAAMHADGHRFQHATGGVWLTRHVPPGYLHRRPRGGHDVGGDTVR